MKRFIESNKLPIDVINVASAKEKGPGRPPFWEMVFWWTRKPLAASRAVILASILPRDFDPITFLRIVYPTYTGRRDKPFTKTPHYVNPDLFKMPSEIRSKLDNIALLDPFAGFGSIPLEALRLGLGKVVATELLPVAVVFLRAVLEYPLKAARDPKWKNLIKDVEKWGKWIIHKLQNDPDIQELYDEDVAVYIGSWMIKCPYCGKYTPLIGNWWLARVKDKKGYEALAWIEISKQNGELKIEIHNITDRNALRNVKTIRKGQKTIAVKIGDEEKFVGDKNLKGEPNIDAKRQEAICLHCYARIKGNKTTWYVKEALRKWNTLLEKYLNGEIPLEELMKASAKPTLLVKVKIKGKDLEFIPATKEDNEKLWKALEKLKQIWGDPDIPTEPIPSYGNIGGGLRFPVYSISKWYQFFNPRQLITLVKLVKFIRMAGKKVEEEKLKEGFNKKKVFEYAEAVTTYLAITLLKHINYNSIATSTEPTQKFIRETLAFRGIGMTWNWIEGFPIMNILGSFIRSLKSVVNGLSYLVSAVSGSSSMVRVLLDDATVLGMLSGKTFDVIITDPPYRDDVAYAELSDFYYVWLKRALSDVDGGRLVPRFHGDVFFENGIEVRTQWEWFAGKEVSLNVGRCRHYGYGVDEDVCEEVYKRMLIDSFKAMSNHLRDDGLLVTFFAQSSPLAWAALVRAGVEAGLYVSNAFPVITESEESIVSRGKAAITSSIVVVWRKKQGDNGVLDIASEMEELIKNVKEFIASTEEAWRYSLEQKLCGIATYVMSYAYTLGLLTRHDKVLYGGRELEPEELVHLASLMLANAYAAGSGASLKSDEAIFYYIVKKVFGRGERGRRLASSSDLILLSYGFLPSVKGGKEAKKRLEKALERFTRAGILVGYGREKETGVASRKTYLLNEPAGDDEVSVSETLRLARVDPDKLDTVRNPVHALHVLMLYALKPRDVFKKYYEKLLVRKPGLVQEAIELAKALTSLEDDPEAELARRVLEYLDKEGYIKYVRRKTLDDYFAKN